MNLQTDNTDEMYMRRTLQLAAMGLGNVQPNPMVGCVIVYQNRIIGEGFHQKYGEAHAEINAIDSVKESVLLQQATLYVNLEPCSHYGKTPPCAETLIRLQIPRVVIACQDPNPQVSGKGIEMLKQAGIKVVLGVLESEARFLNRRFFTFMEQNRPYIILKWAQTLDGFMDIDRSGDNHSSYWITNEVLKFLSHRWRTQESAIAVGYRTVINDNPQLTARLISGKNPVRLIYDKSKTLSSNYNVFNNEAPTYCFSSLEEFKILTQQHRLQSVIIEGGKKTLELFIRENFWDEARVLTGNSYFGKGLSAPQLGIVPQKVEHYGDNTVAFYYR